jgi:hypothetical protein
MYLEEQTKKECKEKNTHIAQGKYRTKLTV